MSVCMLAMRCCESLGIGDLHGDFAAAAAAGESTRRSSVGETLFAK